MDMKFLKGSIFASFTFLSFALIPTILSLVPRKNQKETSKVPKFVSEKNLKKHVSKTLLNCFFFTESKNSCFGNFFKMELKIIK
jgi:hypothetical protein